MFYNFNRHKQKATQVANPKADELATIVTEKIKATRRRLAGRMTEKLSGIPVHWQKAICLAVLGSGAVYCLWLAVPNLHGNQISEAYHTLIGKSNSIRAATPSPKQQAFENYLDSLERAFIADSIYHSQQNTNAHADQTIQP